VFRAVEREFLVKASPTRAWEHLALVERWPTWARHIRRVVVSPPGPLGPESSGQIRLRNGVRSTFRMAALDPPLSWMWVGRFLGLHVSYDHGFEPAPGGGTRLVWRVDVTGPGAAVLGRLFGSIYNRSLDVAIPLLIAELES